MLLTAGSLKSGVNSEKVYLSSRHLLVDSDWLIQEEWQSSKEGVLEKNWLSAKLIKVVKDYWVLFTHDKSWEKMREKWKEKKFEIVLNFIS